MTSWFLMQDDGQDVVEYALILACICLAGAALYFGIGDNVNTIWGIVNSRLTDAASSGS